MRAFRTSLLFFLAIALSHTLSAECYYTNFLYTVELTTANQKTVTAYQEISKCDVASDSVFSGAHLLRVILRHTTSDSPYFFKDLVKLKYCIEPTLDCADSEKSIHYSCSNAFEIKKDSIVCLRIVDMVEKESFTYADTDILVTDTVWALDDPLTRIDVHAYLCSSILLYFGNELEGECASATQDIYAFKKEIENLEQEGWFDVNNGDNFDDKLNRLIADLRGCSQLVVISTCTD